MLEPALTGCVAAAIVALTRYSYLNFPNLAWSSPVFLLGIGGIAMVLQRFLLSRRSGAQSYDGLSDLFTYIHSPFNPDSAIRWVIHGFISFLLAFFGGCAGPEGAAIEFVQAIKMGIRTRSSRWFEQRRRTNAGTSIAGGISAAFGTPFAGMLLPMEMGIGGRSISSATSALAAFLALKFFTYHLGLYTFNVRGILSGFHISAWREWLAAAVIGAICGVAGVLIIRFVRYTEENLKSLFQTQAWMRILAGALLLALVFYIYRPSHEPSSVLLEHVLWTKHSALEVLLLFFIQLFSLSLVLASFGTMGLFWPLFTLGGLLGCCLSQHLFSDLVGFSAAGGITGGAALLGVVLGAPLASAVLAFELTQDLNMLLPCLVAGLVARTCRDLLRTRTLMDKNLEAKGITLVEGRSKSVLDSITVSEAMATDHEIVHEQEPVAELHLRIIKSPYPFLPVVNSQGTFRGLLTIDMIQDAWQDQEGRGSQAPVNKLLEAKDLLYKTGFKTPTVRVSDRLSVTAGIFDDIPCVPVLGEDQRVLGLLFVYHVRSAYDREVARRSFSFVREGMK